MVVLSGALMLVMACAGFPAPGSEDQPPPTPTGLLAVPGDQQVNLSWDGDRGMFNFPTSYCVKRAELGAPFTILSFPVSSSYIDRGLTNGTTYR